MIRVAAETGRESEQRRFVLTRRVNDQKGSVRLRCGNWTLRYREIDHATGTWKPRRVVLGKFKDEAAALKAAEPIMAQVNQHNYAVMDELEIARAKGMHGYHIFRHSAGTILHKRSRGLKVVQSLLRHSDISTTADIYVHLDDEVVSEGVGILADEILGNCAQPVSADSRMVS